MLLCSCCVTNCHKCSSLTSHSSSGSHRAAVRCQPKQACVGGEAGVCGWGRIRIHFLTAMGLQSLFPLDVARGCFCSERPTTLLPSWPSVCIVLLTVGITLTHSENTLLSRAPVATLGALRHRIHTFHPCSQGRVSHVGE